MGDRWVFRTNRAFGALGEGEEVSFDRADDPVMLSLMGTGYFDVVAEPEPAGVAMIGSAEKVFEPTITVEEM